MIKLEAADTTFGGVFYFHNMKDCEDFMYVFEDHFCNVPWKQPVEMPDTTPIRFEEKKDMNKPPRERAESNLSWGFNLTHRLGIGLTDEQNDFVKSVMERF